MILDMYKCVYVWEGRGANEEEKRLGMELAVEYARSAPDKRPADSPIYHVKSGREPRLFIYAFHGWDRYGRSLFVATLILIAVLLPFSISMSLH